MAVMEYKCKKNEVQEVFAPSNSEEGMLISVIFGRREAG